MSAVARWCYQHRFVVIGAWLLVLLGLGAGSTAIGSAFSDGFSLPGTESTKATDLLATQFHGRAGDADTIVFRAKRGQVTEPQVESAVAAVLARVATVPQVGSVTSPFGPQGAGQVSTDGRIAYATVTFTEQAQSLDTANVQRVVDIGSTLRSDTLQVEFGGAAVGQLDKPSTSTDTLIGLIAAALVLLLAFASLLAMAIPLIAAVLALGSALFSIDLLSHVLSIGSIAPIIAALVGLGVGVDYALFVVTRYRNGLRAGLPPE